MMHVRNFIFYTPIQREVPVAVTRKQKPCQVDLVYRKCNYFCT
jgi:hypothetical protein